MATNNEEYIRRNRVVMVDDDKNTRLHYAASLDNLSVVEEEISNGQKIDPENYLGWTPLMMAVRNGNKDVINMLLKFRADATRKNKFGNSVFLISVTCGNIEILTTILEHLLSGGISRQSLQRILSPISLAILFGHSHIFKYLISRSLDVNVATPLTGLTPLMFAAAVGNTRAMKRLLQFKADINKKNYLGKTAFDITQSKNQRLDINFNKKIKPQVPLIIISPNIPNSPCLQLTPYPRLPSNTTEHVRKSSNTITPQMFCSPNITPITPNVIPQVFFPPNFTPSQYPGQYVSPAVLHPDFLNAHITQSPYYSPVPPPQMCYTNYA